MKVVLFCGGLGMRLKEYSEIIPKPMINIGYRPILWYVMKYYAHFGHKDFILCLGYKADIIKNYFLNYNEYLSNDFTLTEGGKNIALASSDIQDWKITFVDTGLHANIGMRLKAVQKYVENEEYFLANYTDGLANCPLPDPHRDLQSAEQDGPLRHDAPRIHVPHRQLQRRWKRHGHQGRLEVRDLAQRRLLRLPAVDLRLHRPRRGARPGTVPAAHREEGADHLQARRVLPGHGHLQGEAAPRRHVRARRDAVGSLEDRARRLTVRP